MITKLHLDDEHTEHERIWAASIERAYEAVDLTALAAILRKRSTGSSWGKDPMIESIIAHLNPAVAGHAEHRREMGI